MSVHSTSIKLIITIALLTTSASGQATTTQPANSDKSTVVTPKTSDLESQVAAVKAENAAFRDALRKMEEQQKVLLEMVDRLQRKLDEVAVGNASAPDDLQFLTFRFLCETSVSSVSLW